MMKDSIALPPFHVVEKTKFTVETDHELTQELRGYQAFYQDAYGVAVSEAELLREMARRFMAADKKFQGRGRRHRRTKRTQSATSLTVPGDTGKLDLREPTTR